MTPYKKLFSEVFDKEVKDLKITLDKPIEELSPNEVGKTILKESLKYYLRLRSGDQFIVDFFKRNFLGMEMHSIFFEVNGHNVELTGKGIGQFQEIMSIIGSIIRKDFQDSDLFSFSGVKRNEEKEDEDSARDRIYFYILKKNGIDFHKFYFFGKHMLFDTKTIFSKTKIDEEKIFQKLLDYSYVKNEEVEDFLNFDTKDFIKEVLTAFNSGKKQDQDFIKNIKGNLESLKIDKYGSIIYRLLKTIKRYDTL